MRYYKELLLSKLADAGWEIAEESEEADWWLESWWKIRSIKQFYGYEVFILFLVDPQYEGDCKSKAVWEIGASESFPDGWPLENGIAEVGLTKGKVEERLIAFVCRLNQYRDEVRS